MNRLKVTQNDFRQSLKTFEKKIYDSNQRLIMRADDVYTIKLNALREH